MGSTNSCDNDEWKKKAPDALGPKAYSWYGFNVLSAKCKLGDAVYFTKGPNVYLYVCMGLAAIIAWMFIARQRARFSIQ